MSVVEFDKINTKPQTDAELQASLQGIKEALQAGAMTGEAALKAAEDLRAAADSAKEAKREAALALELAQNATRTAPGKPEQLKHIPLKYNVDNDEVYAGKMHRAHYNALMLGKHDIAELDKGTASVVNRFRQLNDACVFVDHLLLAKGGPASRDYLDRGGIKGTWMYREAAELAKRIALASDNVAMDTTDTSNWVPTGVSSMLIEDVRAQFEVANYIDTVPMPRSPYLYPVLGTSFRGYLVAQATANTGQTQIGTRAVDDQNVTFTASTIGALVLLSMELEQDSIVPIVAAARSELAYALAGSVESILVNGQKDTGFDTGDVAATDDDRYAAKGLRYWAIQTGVSYDFGGGVVEAGLRKLIAGMGRHGKRPGEGVWITGYTGFAQLLGLKDGTGKSLVLTPMEYGAQATLPTGTLGYLYGRPLVVSDFFPENANASGVVDGASNTTGIVLFNRRMFKLGQVMLPTIEASREQFWQFNQLALKGNLRIDFQPVRTPSASIKSAALGTNIPLTF